MKAISKIAAAVSPSATLAVNALAKKMRAEGKDVVGFGTGEPDFETPDRISYAGIRAICDGQTKYTPAAGIVPLRKAVCKRLKEDYDLDYDETQVVVASGAKHSVYLALAVLVDPGDEVILPAPYWVSYYEMIRLVGGMPVVVTAGEDQNFKITAEQLEAAITEKTKAVMINNPSNPTGAIYTKEELQALADVCVRHDLFIIADEIYDKLIYDGARFTSIPTLGEDVKAHTILINGVSKTYSMTGWRVGYAVAEKPVASAMSSYASHSTGAPATMAQYAAQEALEGPQDEVEAMRKVFEERRNYLVSRMNAMDGVSCLTPNGAFYVMMNLEQLFGKTIDGEVIATADDFARLFLEKSMVAVVSCTAFGAPSFVRWSYATSMENIQKGMDRLEQFLAKVKAQN
ncbi:MAG: pyridoxal phosphate-dependent aminotransferase [Clostridiales bacterium]|nr:pyridoxal phosphate-dependent aminotransferase [Clostridiales bacterium]MDD6936069.1 pyridoxal phosphate-dependent aminotransferase [Clostridiales bacterium]MDY2962072.1 pyridoxal phosphate-dependent aminotransferase [Oscillospiraceae bacterium]